MIPELSDFRETTKPTELIRLYKNIFFATEVTEVPVKYITGQAQRKNLKNKITQLRILCGACFRR